VESQPGNPYDFHGGVFTFNVDTAELDDDELKNALFNAVGWAKDDLTIDMALSTYISSRTIGQLIDAAAGLRYRGKRLTVVARPKVALMLKRTGFDRLATLVTAEL